jgi:hypothetical protein
MRKFSGMPLLFILFLLNNISAFCQDKSLLIPYEEAYKRKYTTVRLSGSVPVIDGKLDDLCWKSEGAWSQCFIQNTPVERGHATYPTRIKILYDDKNIFFALRAWDPEPGKINRFVGNRDDNSIGDLISVCFDTYHDYRAGTEFNINAGGNKTDLIVSDNLTVNLNWNAVWEGKTAVDDSSWTAEFRIPLNQLRYNHSDTGMVWGLHVRRIVRRIQEVDQWSLIPRNNSGHVYSFGEMYGLKGVRKPRLIEFLPYVSGKATSEPRIAGSPYSKGTLWNGNAGIDGKIGIGNFTFDVTINPDFGQVEADPSVMNLTALETYYDEKRPFFLEGKHIFDFSPDLNMMFYSRRIGHAPSIAVTPDNVNSFYKGPEYTTILDAIKLTGTTRNGFSVGILQSTTQEEIGQINSNGIETKPIVEPLTNYVVARVQKIASKGNIQMGGMVTSTNRNLDAIQLNPLNHNAFTAGIDYLQYFRKREYYIDFKGIISYINGKQEAMLTLQQNALHYFQRSDAQKYLGVDSSRRSLTGSGGYISFGRKGNKRFIFSEKVDWWSPGFDLNDLGYQYMADLIENHTRISYREADPKPYLRNYTATLAESNYWNYGGLNTRKDLGIEFISMFTNRWELSFTEYYIVSEFATRLLRGGPALKLSPYWQHTFLFNTDKSKRVVFRFQNLGLISSDKISGNIGFTPGLTFRLGNHTYLMSDFSYSRNKDNFIYVTQTPANGEMQYIMARIKQQTFGLTFRLNYNITPDISIQYYGSPFVSSGSYSDFKRAADTHAHALNDRFHAFTNSEISFDESSNKYLITEGAKHYAFDNPNFSFREFRSNLVFRWEYKPGSTLYLVWENNRHNKENQYYASLNHNVDNLFGIQPTNVFMIKLSYWLGI